MPVPESTATEIRNRAKEAIAKARCEASRPAGTVNDTIRLIESAREKPGRAHARAATTTCYHRCFYCGDWSSGFIPSDQKWLLGDQARRHSCGYFPWQGLHPDSASAPNVIDDIQPYFDVSCGPRTKGVLYVQGKGGLITSRAHLREVARLNGQSCR